MPRKFLSESKVKVLLNNLDTSQDSIAYLRDTACELQVTIFPLTKKSIASAPSTLMSEISTKLDPPPMNGHEMMMETLLLKIITTNKIMLSLISYS